MSDGPRRIVSGTVDAEGRLVLADPPLARLQAQAGGRVGGALALPALASAARLARRLRLTVSRAAVAADRDGDVDLWVRASPIGPRVRLGILDWRERAPAFGGIDRQRDFVRAEHDWWWSTDAALTLTALSPGAPGGDLLGQPLSRLVTLEPDETGRLPLLDAQAGACGFGGQPATIAQAQDGPVRLSAEAIEDGAGRFAGFRGVARVGTMPWRAGPDEPRAEAFGERLGSALRAPLDRIIVAADAIGAREGGPLRRDYAGYAADIASAGRHLLALVGDLVDLSAIERPDYRPEVESIDLADLARRAGGLLALRALEREVEIDVPKAGESVPASGEFRRVLQILVNLIGNAVRYSPAGGAVWVRGEAEPGCARLVVADQGRGIASADQARIFDKFERVDATEPGGTGLGLYISRRLARTMGGDVTVESAPGQGARFILTLPR